MSPDTFKAWQPVFRDFVIVLVASFILLHETLVSPDPNGYLIGAGLTLLGAPAALRADALKRKSNENGNDKDDRWSHMP